MYALLSGGLFLPNPSIHAEGNDKVDSRSLEEHRLDERALSGAFVVCYMLTKGAHHNVVTNLQNFISCLVMHFLKMMCMLVLWKLGLASSTD